MKKLSLSLILASTVIFTTACSELDKIGNEIEQASSQPKQEQTTTATTQAPNEQDTIRRIIAKMQSLKSWQIESKTSEVQTINGKTANNEITKNITYTSNPFTSLQESTTSNGDYQASYVKDGVLYLETKSGDYKDLRKGTIPESMINNYKRNLNAENFKDLYIILEANKDFTLTQTDTNYIIEFKPANPGEFKDKLFGKTNENITDFSLDSYSVKYTVDKKTNVITNIEKEETMTFSSQELSGIKTTSKTSLNVKNVDKTAEVTLPENAANATDDIKFE